MAPEMVDTMRALRKKLIIGFLGGSDFNKIREQLVQPGEVCEQPLSTEPRLPSEQLM